jgi:hypothetical protein
MVDILEGLARDRERQPQKCRAYKLVRNLRIELDPDINIPWAPGLRTKFDGVAHEPLPNQFLFMLELLDGSEWRASPPLHEVYDVYY